MRHASKDDIIDQAIVKVKRCYERVHGLGAENSRMIMAERAIAFAGRRARNAHDVRGLRHNSV